MASEPEEVPAGPQPPGLSQRIKTTVAVAKDKAEDTRQRLEAARPDHASVDVAFNTVERDAERGGGLIAGALAYRFFFWVLPFVLVLVGAIGFAASADEQAPQDLAKKAGFLGFAAQSVATASKHAEHARFWALIVGLPALYFASVAFVKALMIAHSLVWGVPRVKVKRKPLAAAVMTGLLIGIIVALALEGKIRESSQGPGFVATMFFVLVVAGIWLFVSWCMPHADATWWQLVPGALFVAVGVQVVHLVIVYYVSRKVGTSSAYGPLGTATAILLSMFLIARVIVYGASLNAELWRRGRHENDPSAPGVPPGGRVDVLTSPETSPGVSPATPP